MNRRTFKILAPGVPIELPAGVGALLAILKVPKFVGEQQRNPISKLPDHIVRQVLVFHTPQARACYVPEQRFTDPVETGRFAGSGSISGTCVPQKHGKNRLPIGQKRTDFSLEKEASS